MKSFDRQGPSIFHAEGHKEATLSHFQIVFISNNIINRRSQLHTHNVAMFVEDSM